MVFQLCPLRKMALPFSFSHLQRGDRTRLRGQGFIWPWMGSGTRYKLSWADISCHGPLLQVALGTCRHGPCCSHSQVPGTCSICSQKTWLKWRPSSSPAGLWTQALCVGDGLCGSLWEARDALFALRDSV